MNEKFFHVVWRVVGPILRFFHPLEISGLENLPASGAMLCPNHSSLWDPVLLAITTPIDYHLRIMAKEELFRISLLGPIISRLGAFPVSRGNSDIHSVKTAIRAIRDGENLLIFPEGTRVDYPGQVQAKSGVAVIAVRTGAVMVPVFLDGKKRLFHRTRLIIGHPVTPVYTGRHGTSEEMQDIADEVLRRAYALGGETL